MEGAAHWLISACLMTSSVIAFGANSFLLIIFCRRRGLRTVPNRFVINLLIVNLLSSLLLLPLLLIGQSGLILNKITTNQTKVELSSKLIIEEITNNTSSKIEIIETVEEKRSLLSSTSVTHLLIHDERGGEQENGSAVEMVVCCLNQTVTSLVSTLSLLSILLIGINQYFGVIHSLRYHFYINKCRSTCSIISTWMVALLCAFLSALTHHRKRRDKEDNISLVFPILNTLYAIIYFLFIILAPFVAICAIYIRIYKAAHKNSERMRKSTSANLIQVNNSSTTTSGSSRVLQKVQSAPNFAYLNSTEVEKLRVVKVVRTCSERSASSNNFLASLKSRISHASEAFRCREETRAAKISFLVIALVLVCYVPYGVGVVAGSDLVGVQVPRVVEAATLALLGAANAATPFLFAYRNRRVKREIGRVLGRVGGEGEEVTVRRRMSTNDVVMVRSEFLDDDDEDEDEEREVPEVVVTCSGEGTSRKSILKRVVCGGTNWGVYKKCNFIAVPESCCSGEARGSFSSASTQISNED